MERQAFPELWIRPRVRAFDLHAACLAGHAGVSAAVAVDALGARKGQRKLVSVVVLNLLSFVLESCVRDKSAEPGGKSNGNL